MQLVVEVARWMVQDGGEPRLAVGDRWTVDLVFYPDQPLEPAAENAELGLVGEPIADSLARYRLAGTVRRQPATSTHVEGIALEVPGVMLGYFKPVPLPASPLVTGWGTLASDKYSRSMSWAFPEVRRSCLVEGITLFMAPLSPSQETPATFVPDWTRRTESSIERMEPWKDSPKGFWAKYFVDGVLD